MPTFRRGTVVAIVDERPGLQRVRLDLGGPSPERAYVLTQLIGPVAVGDSVVANTTAVDLALGTGGWHFVHWNLSRDEWSQPGPGHIVKLRYTGLQTDTGSAEEHDPDGASVRMVAGMPVVVAGLHSQVAGVVAAIAACRPGTRVAYVMTDGAALPLALSDLVAALRERDWIHATITCGHAFGGDLEAVNVHSAIALAYAAGADVAVVAMGPGIVGTGSTWGFTAIEVATALDAATALAGEPVAVVRASAADPRPRHRGLSHHTATVLGAAVRSSVHVPIPASAAAALLPHLDAAGITRRHRVVSVEHPDPVVEFEAAGLAVTTMGRDAADDRLPFDCAAAAGAAACRLLDDPAAPPDDCA